MMIAVAAMAAMSGGMAIQGGATQTQVSASSAAQPGGGQPVKAQAGTNVTITRRERYSSGTWGDGPYGGYRRRPKGSVARDKRTAARDRNKARRP